MTHLKNLILMILSISFILFAAEGILRIKNLNMKNYDIEMWKYARELKTRDQKLGHVHIPNKSAVLQGVEIKLNSLGMRSSEPLKNSHRRILVLGSSMTLGWGVNQEDGLCDVLQKKLRKEAGGNVEVLNAGIGNYNASRYVELFFEKFTSLHPTDIIVHYFLNDAEILPPGSSNFLLRNSQLAVTLWIAWHRIMNKGKTVLAEHYDKVYSTSYEGYKEMYRSLQKLSRYAAANNIHLYLAMTPDIHFLTDYPFRAYHEQMKKVADSLGYKFIDLLQPLEGNPFSELQAMEGDAHPNARGHKIMAETIYLNVVSQ